MSIQPGSDCMVSGSLAGMLRVSQLLGVAPLRFKSMRRGWRIRVSPLLHLYGQILGIFLGIMAIISILIDIAHEPEISTRTNTGSTRAVWIADVAAVTSVLGTATFTGQKRMRCLVDYLMKLEKINNKLNMFATFPSNERKKLLIAFSSLLLSISLVFINYGVYVNQVVEEDGKVITSVMYIFYEIVLAIVQIILVQFNLIAMTVLYSLQSLNICFKNLLQGIHKNRLYPNKSIILKRKPKSDNRSPFSNKSINSIIDTITVYGATTKFSSKAIPKTIRHLSLLYCSICDVIREVNDCHGALLTALLMCITLHLIIVPYHIIVNILNNWQSEEAHPALQFSWAVVHFTNLLLVIEPCHQTHEEMFKTKLMISQMMRTTTSDHDELMLELEMFYRHLVLNHVTYSPMQMFSLNRMLIVSILGVIATYLIIVVQL